jgi:membrane protein implicated in regulation of membrane protease activity
MIDVDFFNLNDWFWFGLSTLLIIVEVLLGTSFFLLWIGGIAACVGILVWAVPHLTAQHFVVLGQYQFLIFSVSSSVSIILWRKYLKSHPIKTDKPTLNRRSEQFIGKTFILHTEIINGHGKIRVDDSIWRVIGPDLPMGAIVKVMSVDGVTLKVSPE